MEAGHSESHPEIFVNPHELPDQGSRDTLVQLF